IVQNCKKNDVVVPAPTITGFTPLSGTTGTTVTISGINFNTVEANNTVKFNGVAATITAATTTSITTTVPQGATTGKITVTTNGKAGASFNDFVVYSIERPMQEWMEGEEDLKFDIPSFTGTIGYKFVPKTDGTITALGLSSPSSGTFTVQL